MTAAPGVVDEWAPTIDRMTSGRGFGLHIESAYALPGLGGASDVDGDGRRVTLEYVTGAELDARWPSEGGQEMRRVLTPTSEMAVLTEHHPQAGYLVTAPGYGRHLVSQDGRRIRSASMPGESKEWLAVLASQVLPLAATLQGLEVFSASAVVIAGQVVALVGPSGAGKTTLGTWLALAGARFFADDVVALEVSDDRIVAHAGLGLARLRPGLRSVLPALSAHGLGEVIEDGATTLVELRRDVSRLPLRALYLLEPAPDGAEAQIALELPDPRRLLASTRNLSVRSPERLRRQLELVSVLGVRARIFSARIPTGGHRRLARAVFEHAAGEVLG